MVLLSTVCPMAERVQKTNGKSPDQSVDSTDAATDASPRRIIEDIDGLLDEIDEVLDVNAEEFVKNYVQKGGE